MQSNLRDELEQMLRRRRTKVLRQAAECETALNFGVDARRALARGLDVKAYPVGVKAPGDATGFAKERCVAGRVAGHRDDNALHRLYMRLTLLLLLRLALTLHRLLLLLAGALLCFLLRLALTLTCFLLLLASTFLLRDAAIARAMPT